MKTAEWQYLTFDPVEKKEDPEGDRYREVTLPAGSENWFATDFDAAKAGWKTGKAPFGQKNGKQEALSANCSVPHCGCNITPATLWDKEVLLMRQTFDVPEFDAGPPLPHRRRRRRTRMVRRRLRPLSQRQTRQRSRPAATTRAAATRVASSSSTTCCPSSPAEKSPSP